MKKITLLFAVVALGIGCQADSGGQLDDNKALVLRAHAEVWSGGDMAAADEIYAAEFVGHWTDGLIHMGARSSKLLSRPLRATCVPTHPQPANTQPVQPPTSVASS